MNEANNNKNTTEQAVNYTDLLGAVRTKFKCVVCGKITAGRMPVENKVHGDGSFRFPRRHYVDGKLCDGVFEEAEWVDV